MTLISVDAAVAFLADRAISLPAETLPLGQARGRIAAAPVKALLTQPAARLSTMDGYAVRLTDVGALGAQLRVVGESAAGAPFPGKVGPGEAARIFTGAILPEGADHILIQENVTRSGDTITYDGSDEAARFVRPAGNDFHKGDILFEAGQHIGPAQILAAAAANHAELQVRGQPLVAILANGNELQEPGGETGPGQTVNSCTPALMALFESWGCEVMDLGIAADDAAEISARLAKASDADLIVPVGGASVGDYDYMHAAVERHGFESIFAKVNVKPGKPTWFGSIAAPTASGRQYILGLPGNPASAYVCAHIFAAPLLGMQERRRTTAKLVQPLSANGGRETYLRAVHHVDKGGQMRVTALPHQDSGLVSPFLSATCLIPRKPDAVGGDIGEIMEIILL